MLVDKKIEQWGFTKGTTGKHLNITVKNVAKADSLILGGLSGIACGATLYIIPAIAVDKYRMTVIIKEEGKEPIVREYNSSITTYIQIGFLFWGMFVYPPKTAMFTCVEDMLDHCINDLVSTIQPVQEQKKESKEIATPEPKQSTGWSSGKELPKEIAAFSGKWRGKWDNKTVFTIEITEIDLKKAEIIYISQETDMSPAVDFSETAKVILGENPKIQFNKAMRFKKGGIGAIGWFTFEMQKDLKALKGVAQWPMDTSKATIILPKNWTEV